MASMSVGKHAAATATELGLVVEPGAGTGAYERTYRIYAPHGMGGRAARRYLRTVAIAHIGSLGVERKSCECCWIRVPSWRRSPAEAAALVRTGAVSPLWGATG